MKCCTPPNCYDAFECLEDQVQITRLQAQDCVNKDAKIMSQLLNMEQLMKGVFQEMAVIKSRDQQIVEYLEKSYEVVQKLLQPKFITVTLNGSDYAIPATLYGDATTPLMITAYISDLYSDGDAVTSITLSETISATAKEITMYLPDASGNQQKYSTTSATFADGSVTLESFTASSDANKCPAISGMYLSIVFDTSSVMPSFPEIATA